MFAPEELLDLREVATASLPDTCDVLRDVRVRQPDNSWTEEETTIYSNVPCRNVPTGRMPAELIANQGQTETVRAMSLFLMQALVLVYADDVVLYLGKRYPVAGVDGRSDQMYAHVIVYDDSLP